MSTSPARACLTAIVLSFTSAPAWAQDEAPQNIFVDDDSAEDGARDGEPSVDDGATDASGDSLVDEEAPLVGDLPVDEPGPGAAGLDDAALTDGGIGSSAPPIERARGPVAIELVHVGGQGTRLSLADDTLTLLMSGRLQTRFTAEAPGDALVPSRLKQPTRIEIARARLYFGAAILDERVRFDLRLDPAKGIPSVLDASMIVTAIRPWLAMQVGQNRTFFSRQYSTRAGDMQFGERPITTDAFDPARDVGVLLMSGTPETPFMVTAGVFRGYGRLADGALREVWGSTQGEGPVVFDFRGPTAVLGRPLVVARLMGGYGRSNPYVESDTDGGPLRISLGAGVLARADVSAIAVDESAVTLDAMLKWQGLSVSGAVFSSTVRDIGILAVAPARSGFHVQGGYVHNGLVEPVVRYAAVTTGFDGTLQQEALVGANLFLLAGHLRLQGDCGLVHNAPELRADLRDVSARMRLQLDVNF